MGAGFDHHLVKPNNLVGLMALTSGAPRRLSTCGAMPLAFCAKRAARR
jgi:hypothetical protein